MQVGITRHNASGLTPTPTQRHAVSPSASVAMGAAIRTSDLDFPDPLLISSRPLRYNVEFNRQVTAVQQADDFLGRAEKQVMTLRQSIHYGTPEEVAQQAKRLTTLLENRLPLSGNTLDRNLQVTLTASPRVNFRLAATDVLLNNALLTNPQPETLLFSLSPHLRDLAATSLPADAEPEQKLRQLGQCLGRLGIQTAADNNSQTLLFSVNERDWPRVCVNLTVRGEGQSFAAEKFTPLIPEKEPALLEHVMPLIAHPQHGHNVLKALHDSLENISSQRQQLSLNRQQIQSQINGMATFNAAGSALHAASRLGKQLAAAPQQFSRLSQALNGQANARSTTVKNLLRG